MSSDVQRVTITGKRQPPISNDVTIVVGGKALKGWTSVRITRGIERCPSDFQVGMTERYPGEVDQMLVLPGQPCEVRIGSDTVITGYVDRVVPTITAKGHSVVLVGRGKCCDLVDCSAEWPSGQFIQGTVLEIAQALAKPFGIKVSGDVGNATVPRFNLNYSETPFEIIERLCRISQLLAYETPDGNLVLARTNTQRAGSGFDETFNVQEATASWGADQRFSVYRAVRFNFDFLPDLRATTKSDAFQLGEYTDAGVQRYRPRYIVAEVASGMGIDNAIDRAQWEACRRYGRSAMVHVVTDSWRDSNAQLYAPNTLALLNIPSLKLDNKSWTISEVTYRMDANGTACDVTLMPPDAFLVQPTLPAFPIQAELVQLGSKK
jgi:prophage tail gpP-like protein